ncbi:GNAT family N-acetyltransferase [Polymorphobacter fuscus]|uniref:GNAT family N-acetyltransferase n=1 Tax=Sandarakinorhabdus fusca TaxID=1439888 RepID=A0A7C9GPY2_9SPHN|nr:GNAT family N-acetyltransferase [Polymorphobacter fuscus]KAB7648534.1 GNAT family N-acetyltransferase [Polymorphobacter fuscus]MQT16071.1 GNAT family N-acetyltransferase [Polymorphobacter fuscus]NJC07650.1 RimJ/RimL family protein N-acetyltransferase [Polymorphobacter fuscus]
MNAAAGPFPLHTPRLVIGRDCWANLALAADPLLDDRLAIFQHGAGFATLQAYLDRPALDSAPGVVLAARTPAGGEVGAVEITEDNIFYFVRTPYRRTGHGAEMVAAVCAPPVMHWLGVSRLRARIVRGNLASVAIAERAGFRFVGAFVHGRPGQTYLQFERRFD